MAMRLCLVYYYICCRSGCVRMHLLCACGLFFDDCGCPEYLCVKCAGATSWRCGAFSASAARHRAAANTALVNDGTGELPVEPTLSTSRVSSDGWHGVLVSNTRLSSLELPLLRRRSGLADTVQ